MNCRENLHCCEDSGVKNVLGFRYITSGKGDFSGEELRTVKGEGITGFVNSHLGTQISGMGGYNEQFGRVKELDLLAHAFMATVGVARGLERRRTRRSGAASSSRRRSCASATGARASTTR